MKLHRSPLTVWGMFPHEERNFRIIVYAVAVVVLRHCREFDGYETAFSGKRSKTLPMGEAKHLKHQPEAVLFDRLSDEALDA